MVMIVIFEYKYVIAKYITGKAFYKFNKENC